MADDEVARGFAVEPVIVEVTGLLEDVAADRLGPALLDDAAGVVVVLLGPALLEDAVGVGTAGLAEREPDAVADGLIRASPLEAATVLDFTGTAALVVVVDVAAGLIEDGTVDLLGPALLDEAAASGLFVPVFAVLVLVSGTLSTFASTLASPLTSTFILAFAGVLRVERPCGSGSETLKTLSISLLRTSVSVFTASLPVPGALPFVAAALVGLLLVELVVEAAVVEAGTAVDFCPMTLLPVVVTIFSHAEDASCMVPDC